MEKRIKNKIICIALLILITTFISCQKRVEKETGWIGGRYDLAANINRAELDKICYDLGTPSTRKMLISGWSRDKKSINGRSYVWAMRETSIIALAPTVSSPKVLYFQARPLRRAGISSTSVAIQLNGHLLKRVKLLPGWKSYSIPIKGDYFSLRGNILSLKHSVVHSKRDKGQGKKKPSAAYDKFCLIRAELADRGENLPDNFINFKRLKIAGDNRVILMSRANSRFSYQLSLSHPAELHFSLGFPRETAEKIEEIEYRILARKRAGEEHLLFSRRYQSDKEELPQDWEDFKVDLTPFKAGKIFLSFQNLLTPRRNCRMDKIYWGNPFVIIRQSEQRRRLNIIIYLVDTLRADHLSCYGNPVVKTPHIDKLASQGVLFQKAFSQCSWTRPSVASLFTSTYPSFHGAITKEDALTEQITTLAEVLKKNGYYTVGFINNPFIIPLFGFHQGFDSYVITYQPLRDRPLYAHHMNQLILPWLEKNASKPFFLYIHTLDPHDPYTPPPPFDTMYEKDYKGSIDGSSETMGQIQRGEIKVTPRDIQHLEALYDGEISLNDAAFGELIKKLKELQIYDRSLIIFTSDHGEEFYEHKGLKHGLTLYEEQINIPLIMKCAPHFPAGKKISSMARIIDIMPTILELVNITIPQQCQGSSLLPLINGEVKSLTDEIYSEEDYDERVLQSIRGGKWKLISYSKTGSLELFNLLKDPKEQHNLAADYPKLTASLMEKIKSWHQEQLDRRAGLPKAKAKKLSPETIKQLKALGYLN